METKKRKKHANFQSAYRRSSNFNNVIKQENFELDENGKVKIVDTKE